MDRTRETDVDHITGSPRSPRETGLIRYARVDDTPHKLGNTVIIIDLLAQILLQFIDTCVTIEGLVLTGNVPLVAGSGELIAWLVTEEGPAGGVFGKRRVGRNESIWTKQSLLFSSGSWMFLVEGDVGVVRSSEDFRYIDHTKTGEILYLDIPAAVGTTSPRYLAVEITFATTNCLTAILPPKTVGKLHETRCERGG